MVTTDKLVSIIIPCYNQGRFLAEAIESALQQSYRPLEVIVVDDGSTDDTRDVVARHPEVITIRQNNCGVSAARNAGARRSTGQYLVFLDSDDRLLRHALEAGIEQMEKHDVCAMVFGRHRRIDADGALLSTTEYPVVEKDHYRQLLISNYIQTPSTGMFRRSVFESVNGFNPHLSYVEDYDLYLRIAREFSIVGHGQIVAEYRRHDANVTDNCALMAKACLSVLNEQKLHVQGNKEWEEARQLGLRIYRKQWAEAFFSKGPASLNENKYSAQDVIVLMRHFLDEFPRRLVRKISHSVSGLLTKRDLRPSGLK